jgi:hypothetical protein
MVTRIRKQAKFGHYPGYKAETHFPERRLRRNTVPKLFLYLAVL